MYNYLEGIGVICDTCGSEIDDPPDDGVCPYCGDEYDIYD